MINVAILAYDGCWGMGVFSATDFFRIVTLLERHLDVAQSYTIRVLSVDGADISLASGHLIRPDAALNDADDCNLIVIPPLEGIRLAQGFEPDPQTLQWLAARKAHGARVLAMTTGACYVAAAGLAKGSLLATHWAFTRQLKKRYPQHDFVAHQSFMHSEGIWSSGSLGGGFDALLEMLAQDLGDHFAQLCATHLLVSAPERLSPILPGHRNHQDQAIFKVQDWIEAHHAEAVSLAQMAREAGLTERTLKRRFQLATRLSPNVYLQKVRIDKAKKLLLSSGMSVKSIAYEVGYENVSFFVRLFKTQVGQTPGEWRNYGL
ncbi:GlxA family transcriptional regulator [Pseudomonas botevensis]|uniref:GlxA family transcriptional regulator n=1 Tax=Pseudomonas botevensis TaxID=2842352 RepID=UPI001C3E6036|nr:helix-turn-helix domain-containing protein [Pseudomonas botevensis]MBV4475248.1 helix-turn-helix domain-containing protein [Pseudomonas botevensis]